MSQRFALKAPRAKVVENDVEKACLVMLRRAGYYLVRQHVGRFKTPDHRWVTMGEPGDPDWLAVSRPSFFLETKRPGEEPSEVQLRRHAELRMGCGFDVVVVESARQLQEWLERLERAP